MSPILTGVIASGISGNLTPPWSPEGAYDSLATITVPSGGLASIEFAGIPNTYKHLQIRWIGRITATTADENLQIRVGAESIDTGSNYSQHILYGNGSSAVAGGSANQTGANIGRLTGANSTANAFGAGVIDILDYANTSKNKTIRAISGNDQNGSGLIWYASGAYYNTAAITTIQFNQLYGSGVFAQNSQFALYGVK
jgi:hypothetical protein